MAGFGRAMEILHFRQVTRVVFNIEPTYSHQSNPRIKKQMGVGMFDSYVPELYLRVYRIKIILIIATSGLLFGGLHLIPWTWTFPSSVESWLWCTSSLYITLTPLIYSFLLMLAWFGAARWLLCRRVRPLLWLYEYSILPYILARLTLIILAFMTLCALPPDAYKDISWNSFIPHIRSMSVIIMLQNSY